MLIDLFSYSTLNKYDLQGIHKVYDKWPELAKKFYETDYPKANFKGIDNMVFAGMGGSGIIGDSLASILSKTDIHLSVVKGFHLPKTMDSKTLLVVTSVSGNTTETISILKKAKKTGCHVISFSSGGWIEKYSMKNDILYTKIPIFNSPRASYPAYVYAILNVLQYLLPLKRNNVMESIKLLENTREKICSYNYTDNLSLKLANWMGSICMIYYPSGLQAAALRFKNSLQENSKSHAIAEDVIEACHNGIVAWERPSSIKPILLQGQDDYYKTKELWKILKKYFEHKNIDYYEIQSVKGNILSKIVNLIYLLDYASIYYSVKTKVNPTPVQSIDFIKEKIQ